MRIMARKTTTILLKTENYSTSLGKRHRNTASFRGAIKGEKRQKQVPKSADPFPPLSEIHETPKVEIKGLP